MPKFVETYFDERSGIVEVPTPWGVWWQTVSEVHIEVNVNQLTKSKDVNVSVKPSSIKVIVGGNTIIEGPLYGTVRKDELIWTIEDKKILHILLSKADVDCKECIWNGLLQNDLILNEFQMHEVKKKYDLERFQIENPGFDFSKAKLASNYDKFHTRTKEEEERRQEIVKEFEKRCEKEMKNHNQRLEEEEKRTDSSKFNCTENKYSICENEANKQIFEDQETRIQVIMKMIGESGEEQKLTNM